MGGASAYLLFDQLARKMQSSLATAPA